MNTYIAPYPSVYRACGKLFAGALCLAVIGTAIEARAQTAAAPAVQKLLARGNEALASQHYQDAEKAFTKAKKLQHDACFPCWRGIALAQAKLGESDAALKSGEKTLSFASTGSERAEAHSLRGQILLDSSMDSGKLDAGKIKQAEAEFRSAEQLDAAKAEYHLRLAVALFKEVRDPEGKAETQQYLQLAPNGAYALWARSLIENPRRAREAYAPDFTVTTLSGAKFSLASYAGKLVVLDFWATWCGPCRESVGELKQLTRKYPQDQLVLLSVSADSDGKQWRDFIASKKMDWQQYLDEDGSIRKLFGVNAFPTYIVIDRDGIIHERIVGLNPQESVVHRLKETLGAISAANGKG